MTTVLYQHKTLEHQYDRLRARHPLFVINGYNILTDDRYLEQFPLYEIQYKQDLLQQGLERIPAVYQRRNADRAREAAAIEKDVRWLGQQRRTLQQSIAIVDSQLLNMQHLQEPRMASQMGQPINIRYGAFPNQKIDLYENEIALIGDHVLLPNERRNTPIFNEEPVYRVTAHLDPIVAGTLVELKEPVMTTR
ncbi:DUF2184 domain-containing protein [Salinispirillum sp. LH 10-3-1]|uniref:DUF2184 domain-containing protein n=1 Tax=Salinispirillum sp. LH 10-3-1 TaxID=2952525 RepID=A0AB38YDE8_9GAMM